MDQYGWRKATKAEVEELARRMDLVPVYHSMADCSLWYLREEVAICKSYMDCTTYARRYDARPRDDDGYEINQRNVEAWHAR